MELIYIHVWCLWTHIVYDSRVQWINCIQNIKFESYRFFGFFRVLFLRFWFSGFLFLWSRSWGPSPCSKQCNFVEVIKLSPLKSFCIIFRKKSLLPEIRLFYHKRELIRFKEAVVLFESVLKNFKRKRVCGLIDIDADHSFSQLTFTCSKSTTETLEKGVKYV